MIATIKQFRKTVLTASLLLLLVIGGSTAVIWVALEAIWPHIESLQAWVSQRG